MQSQQQSINVAIEPGLHRTLKGIAEKEGRKLQVTVNRIIVLGLQAYGAENRKVVKPS